MSDGERAGLLADAETPQTTKHNSRWIAKRWRVFAALGAGACLLAMGVATRAARSNEAALGANEDQVKRETIDARLKSVFGISLEDFAALVRDENDVQIAGKELYEKKSKPDEVREGGRVNDNRYVTRGSVARLLHFVIWGARYLCLLKCGGGWGVLCRAR